MVTDTKAVVVVVGASHNADRASNQAVTLLLDRGNPVYPIHPKVEEIHGLKVLRDISEVPAPIDTLTLYLSEQNSNALAEDILSANPRRIIFNPGAENPALMKRASENGIEVENACSLVLMRTGQF